MKRTWKPAGGYRFTLVIVLLLATAAWAVCVAVADEPPGQKSGQAVVRPLPAAPGPHTVVAATRPEAKSNGEATAPLGKVNSAAEQKVETEAKKTPGELSAIVKKTAALLDSTRFTFLPDKGLDPFVPFVSLQTTNDNNAKGAGTFMTPLQKMSIAEMETGLKAIASGGLGKMAVIEDSSGKGYIVGVGTPAGPNGGVITQIQDNCLVIRQEV